MVESPRFERIRIPAGTDDQTAMNAGDTERMQSAAGAEDHGGRTQVGPGTVPLVGLGGAPNSIGAVRSFLRALPDAPGMAILVTVHPQPGLELPIAELLRAGNALAGGRAGRRARRSKPITIYMLPPATALHWEDGQLGSHRGEAARADAMSRSTCSSARWPTPTGRTPRRWCSRAPTATARSASSASRSAAA